MSDNNKRVLTEAMVNQWKPVLEAKDAPEIKSRSARNNLVHILENTRKVLKEGTVTADVAKYDPVLIALLRRTMPNLVANNLVGVQPMTGPTGLIFAQKIHYRNPVTGVRTETWRADRPDVNVAGDGAGSGMSAAAAEILGANRSVNTSDAGAAVDPVVNTNPWDEMDMTIAQISVTAKTRALKANFTNELAEDLRAIHGLDAETELATILQGEIQAEIDYEILAYLKSQAVAGGVIDINVDTDGRWSVEKYMGLVRLLDRQSNIIGQQTRRGRATWIVTTPDVAGALEMAGKVNMYADRDLGDLNTDVTGLTFVGKLANKWDLYIDPYAVTGTNWALLGYKGANNYDAGAFYTPYTPLTFYSGKGEDSFQPRIGFKTRYGLTYNPYASGAAGANPYFRQVDITNL